MPNNLEKFFAFKRNNSSKIIKKALEENEEDVKHDKENINQQKEKNNYLEESLVYTDDEKREYLKEGLIYTDVFLERNGHDIVSNIYDWYQKAMNRKNRKALEEDRFYNHFFQEGSFDPTCMYGDFVRGFLLGILKNKVFIVTHFAPQSLRKGYELIKELGEEKKIPVIMAVSLDLAKMIKRISGWKLIDFEFETWFRGEKVIKKIAHNKNENIDKLLAGFLKDYLNEYY